MNDIMHRFESDSEVWVAILTGAGNRAFSAGADLKVMASGEGRLIETQAGGFCGFMRFPRTKPVIAAVNGLALAGGTELVPSASRHRYGKTTERSGSHQWK